MLSVAGFCKKTCHLSGELGFFNTSFISTLQIGFSHGDLPDLICLE